jgi:hypothetical protein
MRERALRMLAEARPEHSTMMGAIRHVPDMLEMSRRRCACGQRCYEVDSGAKPGVTTEAAAEIKRLQLPGPQAGSERIPHLAWLSRHGEQNAIGETDAR